MIGTWLEKNKLLGFWADNKSHKILRKFGNKPMGLFPSVYGNVWDKKIFYRKDFDEKI